MVTTIAVFGDLHGNRAATEAVLAEIEQHRPDHVVCLGDLVGYGACPNETIDAVRRRGIPPIMGNYDDGVGHDRDDCGCAYRDATEREWGQRSLGWTRQQVDADRKAYLRSLLPEYRLTIHGTGFRFVHGSPPRMNEYLFEDRDSASLERIAEVAEADVLLFGHTHIPWDREIAGVRFINADSVGKPKDGDPRACWGLLTVGDHGRVEGEFRRVPYDVAAMAAAIRAEPGLPGQFARDLETGGTQRPATTHESVR